MIGNQHEPHETSQPALDMSGQLMRALPTSSLSSGITRTQRPPTQAAAQPAISAFPTAVVSTYWCNPLQLSTNTHANRCLHIGTSLPKASPPSLSLHLIPSPFHSCPLSPCSDLPSQSWSSPVGPWRVNTAKANAGHVQFQARVRTS